jgi:hypothetical protein
MCVNVLLGKKKGAALIKLKEPGQCRRVDWPGIFITKLFQPYSEGPYIDL